MKNIYRRWISGILVAVLVLTSLSTDAYAATGKLAAAAAEIEQQEPKVFAFPDMTLEKLKGTEAVYFGTAQVSIEEGDDYYSFKVHREGDLQTEASVSLLSLDVSALYGKDYEFVDLDVYESGEEMTLLEKSNGNNTIVSNEEAQEFLNQIDESFNAQAEFENPDTNEEENKEVKVENNYSTDATLRNTSDDEQLGSISKSLLDNFVDVNTDLQTDEQISEALDSAEFDYSAGTVLHFAPGEKEKIVKLHIKEDEIEEGDEMFQLMLADAEETVIRAQYTLAVIITDNEELHDSTVCFTEESYSSVNGMVTVTVKREGSLYSLIDFRLKSVQDTAIAGLNYEEFSEVLAMQPYQTEASYSYSVSGNGRMEVVLQAETGCTVGNLSLAEVNIIEETQETKELLGDECEMTKDFGDKKYTIKYEMKNNEPCKGTIWNNSNPKVKIGDYLFMTKSDIVYNQHDGHEPSKYKNEYVKQYKVEDCYGYLRWYSGNCSEKGGAFFTAAKSLSTLYYGCLYPEWRGIGGYKTKQTFSITNTKTKSKIESCYDGTKKWNAGIFSRTVDINRKISLPLKWVNENFLLKFRTSDESKCITDCELQVYGVACMYKAYRVKVSGYKTLEYKTAGGGTISSIPFRLKYEGGVISDDAADPYHTIYVDPEQKKSVIQFSASNIYLNGHSGNFGEVKSYEIILNAEGRPDQKKILYYPEGFVQYLKEMEGKVTPSIGFTHEVVEKRIKEAQDLSQMMTIRLDCYMLSWLQTEEIKVFGSDADKMTADKIIALDFTPVVEYTNINVYVDAPSIKRDNEVDPETVDTYYVGGFADLRLSPEDKPKEGFHAGDTLNLSGKANSSKYRCEGYEYSYNNGTTWNPSANDQMQLTRKYRDVRIRPVFSSVRNRIEITMTEEAKKHLTVKGLINADDLEDSDYEGKYIYNVNPEKSNVYEKAQPVVGQPYVLEIIVEDEPKEKNYIYRPVIKDNKGVIYNTQLFPIIASADRKSNCISIDVEKVSAYSFNNYNIKGKVSIDFTAYMQRDNATARTLCGISGYTVATAGEQTLVTTDNRAFAKKTKTVENLTTSTDSNGNFTINKLRGQAGDRIPLLVSASTTSGQVNSVVLGYKTEVTAGEILTVYPFDAPEVISVMYAYANANNNLDHDTNQNSVNIYDDTLTLQLTVDAKGKKIKHVDALIISTDGNAQTYEATLQKTKTNDGTDIWKTEIKKMTRFLMTGDRLYVQVVGEDNNGKDVFYPYMDTGIVFYEKNVPSVKQYVTVDTPTDIIDIPKMGRGTTNAGATSGICSFSKEDWENGKGYTWSINLGFSTSSTQRDITKKLSEKFKENREAAKGEKLQAQRERINNELNELDSRGKGEKRNDLNIDLDESNDDIDKNNIDNNKDEEDLLENEELYQEDEDKGANISESAIHDVLGVKEGGSLKEQNEKNKEIANAQSKAGDSKAKATSIDRSWKIDAAVLIGLNYVRKNNDYVFQCGFVAIGLTGSLDYHRFAMIGPFPGYYLWGGELQVDCPITFTTKEGKNAISEKTFQNTRGNIADTLKQYTQPTEMTLGVKGYGGVGFGCNNVFGIKGTIHLKLEFGIPIGKKVKYADTGIMVEVGGGVKVDLFVTSLFFNIPAARMGLLKWYGRKDKNCITWGRFLKSSSELLSNESLLKYGSLRKTELIGSDGNEETMLVENLAGSGEMEDFGKEWHVQSLLGASSNYPYAEPVMLKKEVADYTDVQMVQISDEGDQFMVFLDNRAGHDSGSTENGNAQALFYCTYDASERKWSTPKLLDEDGTFDASPDLTVQDDTVTVSWSSSEKEFTKEMNKLDRLSQLRIKTAVFKIGGSTAEFLSAPVSMSGTFASPSDAKKKLLSKNENKPMEEDSEEDTDETAEFLLSGLNDLEVYYDINAHSWMEDGKIYTVFTRFDLSSVNEVEEAADFTKAKPAIYLAEYDLNTHELLTLRNISLTIGDTILVNSDVQFVEVSGIDWRGKKSKGKKFLVVSYTQDTDGNLETVDDNDMKLCLIEINADGSTPFVYPSMDISDENGSSEFSEEENSYPEDADEDEEELISAEESQKASGKSLYNAKITQAGDTYYLTYLKDGYLFELVDIGEYIDGMFEADYTADYYRNKAKSINNGLYACTESTLLGGSGENAWYSTDMDELNEAWKNWSGEDDELWVAEDEENEQNIEEWTDLGTGKIESSGMYYDLSCLREISIGELNTYETMLSGDLDQKSGASNYQIVTDGKDLYILYLDNSENTIEPNKELFCVRFTATGDIENDEVITQNGFSKPVQITDAGHVLNDFSASMANGTIRVVSEYYDQYLTEEGESNGIIFGENNISMLEFRPGSRLEIPNTGIYYDYNYDDEEDANDYMLINYSVNNEGLVPQKGYQTWVLHEGEKIFSTTVYEADVLALAEMDGTSELVGVSEKEVCLLEPGDSDEFEFNWKLPEEGQDEKLTFVVADLDGKVLATKDLEIESKANLEITESDAYETDDGYEASVTLENNGNIPSESTILSLNLTDDDGITQKIYAAASIPSMKPGEVRTIDLLFDPKYSDFDDLGVLNLEMSFWNKNSEGSWEVTDNEFMFCYVAGDPEIGVIGDGKASISLCPGSKKMLNAKVYPLPEMTGTVMYTSSNPLVAEVAEDGTVTAYKNGTTELTAYFTDWNLKETVTLVVSETAEDTDVSYTEILPSYVETNGTWKQDSYGNWVYTTRAGVKAADRWMAIARSTFGGGKGFEWYRFDKNGNMVTGWFKDSDDRMYYLQMISDGNKGRMLTGWQKIDGKWYYFSNISNGYKGEMLKNTATPDGYKVGKDGVWLEK